MPRILSFAVLGIIWFLLISTGALAQQTQQDEGSLLPEIDPQDIEIRTQFQARFPGLRRQPILGFNPRPRVFQVDPNRMPFIESYEDAAVQLPVGQVSRPEAPEYRGLPYAAPKIGFGKFGFGSFFSPEAEMHVNREISEDQWISGNADFRMSDGHLSDQLSSYRFFNTEVNYRGKLSDRSVLGASVNLFGDYNHMLELDSALQDPMGDVGKKSYYGAGTDVRFKNYRNRIEHWDVGFHSFYHVIDLAADGDYEFSSDLQDWSVGGDISRTWIGERLHETYSAKVNIRGGAHYYSGETGVDDTWSLIGVSGQYNRLFDYKTRVRGSFGVYHVSDQSDNSSIYIAPEIDVEHYLTDYLTAKASIHGKPDYTGHYAYHKENRFLFPDNRLRHSYHFKGKAEAILEFLPGNKLTAGFSYQNSKNYPWYDRREQVAIPQFQNFPAYYQIEYDQTSIFGAHASLALHLVRERVWFESEGYLRFPKFSSGGDIPFEESYGLKGSFSVRPVNTILFEAWGDFVGPRDYPGGELGSFLHLGSRVEMKINQRIGVYGKILNLLNQDYEIWQGYRERPFQVYAGLTLIF